MVSLSMLHSIQGKVATPSIFLLLLLVIFAFPAAGQERYHGPLNEAASFTPPQAKGAWNPKIKPLRKVLGPLDKCDPAPQPHNQSLTDPIETSLLMNGDFLQEGDYWDYRGLQEPANGPFKPYDPDRDPGLNHFEFFNDGLIVEVGADVIQRILLSPGDNKVTGLYSVYDPGGGTWSPEAPFEDILVNAYDVHLMHKYALTARNGMKTWYGNIQGHCFSHGATQQTLTQAVRNEVVSILDLHRTTHIVVPAANNALFSYDGLHVNATYENYTDLESLDDLQQTLPIPTPHAELFLSAARGGFSTYEYIARNHARGALSALGLVNQHTVPFRYNYWMAEWLAPEADQSLVYSSILTYFCECADYFKEPDFFEAAYLIAREMLENNWWNHNVDPEGLFFLSDRYALNALNELEGEVILRTPLAYPGASVGDGNDDHKLMNAPTALSRFLRVVVDNPVPVQSTSITLPFLIDCQATLDQCLTSFCTYADKFNLVWMDNFVKQNMLTAAWWTNFDRRDDYAGYNMGLGLSVIFNDQVSLYGHGNVVTQTWAQKMFNYMEAYQPLWDESTRRGGIEAADGSRFYTGFNNIWHVPEGKAWAEAYIDTYMSSLVQMTKGFMEDDYPPNVGTWSIWDWEPYQFPTTREVTVPGLYFTLGSEIYEVSKALPDGDDREALIRALMKMMLRTIVKTAKGEAGYIHDMSTPHYFQGGGELRLGRGLVRLYTVLQENP